MFIAYVNAADVAYIKGERTLIKIRYTQTLTRHTRIHVCRYTQAHTHAHVCTYTRPLHVRKPEQICSLNGERK